jgi:hypothetical protein
MGACKHIFRVEKNECFLSQENKFYETGHVLFGGMKSTRNGQKSIRKGM